MVAQVVAILELGSWKQRWPTRSFLDLAKFSFFYHNKFSIIALLSLLRITPMLLYYYYCNNRYYKSYIQKFG